MPDPEYQNLFFLDNEDDAVVAYAKFAKTCELSFQGKATLGKGCQFLLDLVENPPRLRLGQRSQIFMNTLLVGDSICQGTS